MPFVYDDDRYKDELKIFEIVVQGDTNDADYVHEISEISQLEIDEIVIPALALISENEGRVPFHESNCDEWPEAFQKEQDLIEVFQELYCPGGEYGIHSIESVVYYPKQEKIKLF